MSIFSTSNIHSMTNLGSKPVSTVSVHESMTAGAAAIMYESELNFSNMMKAVGINEVNHYAANGESVVYEGGTLSGFFGKMKEFFRMLSKKIKELYNKFITQIDAWIRSDDAFVKKHRAALLQINAKGFKYNGYEFTTDAVTTSTALNETSTALNKFNMSQSNVGPYTGTKVVEQDKWTKDWKDNKAKNVGSLRATTIGKTGSLTNKEFDAELFKTFRNGKNEKAEISIKSVSSVLDTISNFKAQKDAAKKSMDSIEKAINKVIEDLNKQEKEMNKFGKDESAESIRAKAAAMRYVTELSSAQKDRLGVIQKLHGSLMSAMKHENRQAKSICVRLIGYAPKAKNESTINESGLGIDSVKFI